MTQTHGKNRLYLVFICILMYISTLHVFHDGYLHYTCCHCIWFLAYIHIWFKQEGNVLFNDALNTFYLQLYGVRHMVKYLTDSERGNPLPPHGLLFPIKSKGSFICTIPQTGLHIPQPLLCQLWGTGWNEK